MQTKKKLREENDKLKAENAQLSAQVALINTKLKKYEGKELNSEEQKKRAEAEMLQVKNCIDIMQGYYDKVDSQIKKTEDEYKKLKEEVDASSYGYAVMDKKMKARTKYQKLSKLISDIKSFSVMRELLQSLYDYLETPMMLEQFQYVIDTIPEIELPKWSKEGEYDKVKAIVVYIFKDMAGRGQMSLESYVDTIKNVMSIQSSWEEYEKTIPTLEDEDNQQSVDSLLGKTKKDDIDFSNPDEALITVLGVSSNTNNLKS